MTSTRGNHNQPLTGATLRLLLGKRVTSTGEPETSTVETSVFNWGVRRLDPQLLPGETGSFYRGLGDPLSSSTIVNVEYARKGVHTFSYDIQLIIV